MSAAESRDSIPITVEEPQAPTDHHRTIRPGTSSTDMRPNTAASSKTHLTDPFASPFSSRPSSVRGMSSSHVSFPNDTQVNSRTPFSQPGLSARSSARFTIISGSGVSPTNPAYASGVAKPKAVRMKSHAITEDEVHKPWNDAPNPRARFAYFLTYAVIFLGLAGGIIQCYFAWRNVRIDRSPLCVVMDENFDDEDAVFGPNGSFMREVNMDGFGNGEFEMTTASRNNSYVKDGFLYIVPTLTSDEIGQSAVFDGAVYNITGCTFNETAPNHGFIESGGQTFFDVNGYNRACSAVSNATAGTIINPVQSARLTTRNKASIRFGRVEIRAKMPNGDWLWPALWMLPRDNVYGPWPLSGEIDIVESRGNGIRYTARGSNSVQGTLNWGPAPQLNGAQFSFSWWTDKRKSFGSDFHTYLLEWTEEFLRISVDSRLHTLLDLRFNKPFFQRGNFPQVVFNGSSLAPLQNPWTNGTNATPFDQEFYLIMNVAVGGTNGWFPEAQGDKPWLDRSGTPMRDFASAEAKWYPTWPTNVQDRAMIVDYVKMWKHC